MLFINAQIYVIVNPSSIQFKDFFYSSYLTLYKKDKGLLHTVGLVTQAQQAFIILQPRGISENNIQYNTFKVNM